MWEGVWNADKTVFTGTYTWADGGKFIGVAQFLDAHVIRHVWPGMGEIEARMPAGEHFEFTGSWEKDGHAIGPAIPPDPER